MNITRQHITALTAAGPVTARTVLIGREDLGKIVAELTEALQPCGQPVAQAEVKRLAACYPTFRPSKEWLEQITDTLKNAPCDLIRKACHSLADTATFPPNKAQVKEAVQILTDNRRAVRYRAKEMLREHERRAAALAEEAERQQARAAFRAKLGDRSPLEFFREELKK